MTTISVHLNVKLNPFQITKRFEIFTKVKLQVVLKSANI